MLPGPSDALALWGFCLVLAAIIAVCVRTGRTLGGRWTIIRREEQPGLFWTMVGVLGVFLFVSVVAALTAIAPWPPGANDWAAPDINPNASLSNSRP